LILSAFLAKQKHHIWQKTSLAAIFLHPCAHFKAFFELFLVVWKLSSRTGRTGRFGLAAGPCRSSQW
jgi:hypothetical protein